MTVPLPDRPFAALLFDMDGTILASMEAAGRFWGRWGRPLRMGSCASCPRPAVC